MAIERRFTRVLAAWVGILAILTAGNSHVVRCHAAAPHLGDDHVLYDSNDPQTLSDQGSIIGWGDQRVDSSVLDAQFIAITAGSSYSLALKTDGSIVGWGLNQYGRAAPPDGNDFIAIATGYRHSLALRKDGSVVGWGHNLYRQATPPVGNNFIAIAAGSSYSLALKKDGSMVGWGSYTGLTGTFGQATPPDGNDFIAIAAGYSHSLAIRRTEPPTAP